MRLAASLSVIEDLVLKSLLSFFAIAAIDAGGSTLVRRP